jgi:hypothetical protein
LNGKVAAPGLENRDYGRGDPLRLARDTLSQLKLALTWPTGCGRSVGIVRLRTKTTEFFLVVSYTTLPLYHQENSPRYPLDRRLGGPQSRPGLYGEQKTLFPLKAPAVHPVKGKVVPCA